MNKHINLKNYDVILRHIISEKSSKFHPYGKYSFQVSLSATKKDIKDAVESMFDVKVRKVNTLVQKGKKRNFKGHAALLSDWKKALVTLDEGFSIDVAIGGDA
jgi:large subunit ribosomal protein L23